MAGRFIPRNVTAAVDALENASPALPLADNIAGIGEIFSGPSIALYYNAGDSRAPDILVTPNIGVTYSNSTKKLAEHGGFAHDDINVIMLVSNPDFRANTVTTPVQTKQVAPTILEALGLNPQSLKAVRLEHTPILPGLPLRLGTRAKGAAGRLCHKRGGRPGYPGRPPLIFRRVRMVSFRRVASI